MGDRLIPRGDGQFRLKVYGFARTAAADPARFGLSAGDAEALLAAVMRLDRALQQASGAGRSRVTTIAKNEARAEAERLYKRCIERVRVYDGLDAELRCIAGLREPSDKRRRRHVPQEPPVLRFERVLHQGAGAAPVHELSYRAPGKFVGREFTGHGPAGSKPAGAVRIELFADLVPPDGPVPHSPGDNNGGRQWYLRSFSRSPIRVTPPMARVPMLVVYWGRWADAVGNVGPFSATVVSRVEGVSSAMLFHAAGGRAPNRILEAPVAREPVYSVAVRDGQFEYPSPPRIAPPSPDPDLPRPRQLEGPPPATEAA